MAVLQTGPRILGINISRKPVSVYKDSVSIWDEVVLKE